LSNERRCRGRVPSGIIRYRQHVLETKGKDLDDAGKALLAEDLRSPCTEEIAVFQAFS
jgi:arsenite/tail-anchored protein-transporting ATPase